MNLKHEMLYFCNKTDGFNNGRSLCLSLCLFLRVCLSVCLSLILKWMNIGIFYCYS